MSLIKWNRPSALSGQRNWIENFFTGTEDFFKDFEWGNNTPAVNVLDEEKQFTIEVAAPGMKKEDFKVDLSNGVLTICAKSEQQKEDKKDNFVRREFSYQNFQRSFWLPDNVDAAGIKAAYDQGMLKLSLPKMANGKEAASKSIEIV